MNPWNTAINNSNNQNLYSIDQLKGIETHDTYDIYDKILNATNVKKHYMAFEFNKINNPEFHDEKLYSLDQSIKANRQQLFTPQINNISFHMPDRPVLYEWDSVPKVNF